MPPATQDAIRAKLDERGRLDDLRWIPLAAMELAPLMPGAPLGVAYDVHRRPFRKDTYLRIQAWYLSEVQSDLIVTAEGEYWSCGRSSQSGSYTASIRHPQDMKLSAAQIRKIFVEKYPDLKWDWYKNSIKFEDDRAWAQSRLDARDRLEAGLDGEPRR